VEQRLLDRPADVSVFSDKGMTLPAGAQTIQKRMAVGCLAHGRSWHPIGIHLRPTERVIRLSGNRLATPHIGYSRYGDLKTPISGKREIGYHAKNGKTARSAGSAFADQL
jgi:hypothetical protein